MLGASNDLFVTFLIMRDRMVEQIGSLNKVHNMGISNRILASKSVY